MSECNDQILPIKSLEKSRLRVENVLSRLWSLRRVLLLVKEMTPNTPTTMIQDISTVFLSDQEYISKSKVSLRNGESMTPCLGLLVPVPIST
jgi:hypothetical protein